MRLIPNHGYLPVTLEEAQRAGRDRAWHDASTQLMKSAARVLARRSLEKQAAEGDIGAILSGAIANKFGTRAALNELAQTEDSKREPAVTDPQEDLPQIPSGRSVNPSPPAGQLMEAGSALDRMSQVYGLSKRASACMSELEKDAWNPVTNFIRPIGRDLARAGRAVHKGFLQPIGQDVAAAAGHVKGKLMPAKTINLTPAAAPRAAVTPQLATAQQAATFRPVGTPPPLPAAAQAAQGGAGVASGHVVPQAGAPAAPGAAQAPGQLSRKGRKASEIEGVQQKPKYKGPGLLGGLATGGLLVGGAYGLAKGLPAAAHAMENATANPMAYGMGYSNLPYGYGQQEYTNF